MNKIGKLLNVFEICFYYETIQIMCNNVQKKLYFKSAHFNRSPPHRPYAGHVYSLERKKQLAVGVPISDSSKKSRVDNILYILLILYWNALFCTVLLLCASHVRDKCA